MRCCGPVNLPRPCLFSQVQKCRTHVKAPPLGVYRLKCHFYLFGQNSSCQSSFNSFQTPDLCRTRSPRTDEEKPSLSSALFDTTRGGVTALVQLALQQEKQQYGEQDVSQACR
ncbi:uncharacterized [Tachysurus ichikawai]